MDTPIGVVEVQVDEAFREQVEPVRLRRAAEAALHHEQVTGPCEVTVVVTSDEVSKELNRRHRDVDAPTDVLAFPDDTRGPFVDAPGTLRYLGDVVVSFPRAEAQAAEAGHGTEAELQLLVVHGVLHLLGYDDRAKEPRARMWEAQSEILRNLGVDVNPPE